MKTKANNLRKETDSVPFYTELYVRLITDVAVLYDDPVVKQESRLDCAKVRKRVEGEGIFFLTKTLPLLGKEVDKSLSTGTRLNISGFQKESGSELPKIFGWLFKRVFSDDGSELSNSDPRALGHLRQLLYYLYKLEMPFTEAQQNETLQSFKDTDAGLPDSIPSDNVIVHARNFLTSVFGSFDPFDIIPRHGPGATATGEKNHEKHNFKRFYSAIDNVYPYSEYMLYTLDQLALHPQHFDGMEFHVSGTAKVVLVPKDSRGPRVISCEPLEYQWMQGGLGEALVRHLERNEYTCGRVNFANQDVNRNLALAASAGDPWVTLDMKDASDRVSCALVKVLFRDCPHLLEALMALRTTATKLPSGEIVQLKKYAPMGSSLCFPVESIVFFALGVGVLLDKQEREGRVGGCSIRHAAQHYKNRVLATTRRLRVYGDDIISRLEDYEAIIQYFPKVGLMFNTGKCCTQGSFRESCGMDAYRGVCVTPLRLKRMWNISRSNSPDTLMAYVVHSNHLYAMGFTGAASHIEDAVNKSRPGLVPYLEPTWDTCYPLTYIRYQEPSKNDRDQMFAYLKNTPFERCIFTELGILVFMRHRSHVAQSFRLPPLRWNTKLWRAEAFVHQVTTPLIKVPSTDWSMVLRRYSLASKHGQPGLFASPRRITLQRGWVPIDLKMFRRNVEYRFMVSRARKH